MPLPSFVPQLNKKYLNRAMVHLAGHGPFVELEHRGRKSGRVYRVPIMAFRDGSRVTVALTYGSGVDWLLNLRVAAGARMHSGGSLLTLGPPLDLSAAEGLRRMPLGPRQLLPLIGCREFVEFHVVGEQSFTGWD